MSYAQIQMAIRQNEEENKRIAGIPDSEIKIRLTKATQACSVSLKDVASCFFDPKALRYILDAKTETIDRHGYIVKNQMQSRCRLSFGDCYGLDDAQKKGLDLHDLEFPDKLVSFLSNSFIYPANEKESVTKSIMSPNNRTLIILERSVQKQASSSKDDIKYRYKDGIIAMAICLFHSDGCHLLWFATNKNQLPQKLNEEKNSKGRYRQKGFGSLLLAIVQTFQEIMHGNNYVYCQANTDAAVGFYLQHHFEIMQEETELYKKCKERLTKIHAWLTADDLVLLKSRAKINVLHTWIYEDCNDVNAFNQFIIPQLVEVYFPNIAMLGHRNNVDITNLNNIIHGIDPLANIESFEWSSLLADKQDDILDKEKNPILFANNDTLEDVLAADNCTNQLLVMMPQLLPSYRTNDHTDNLFCIMSQILYHTNDHENDIRSFFGFLYSVFSVLSDDHPFLQYTATSKNKPSENLQSFNIAKDLCNRLEDEYKEKELIKILGLSKDKKFKEPKVIKKAFKLLKSHIIPYGMPTKVRQDKVDKGHVLFRGYPMDIVLFSNIIYPSIYLLSAKTYDSKDFNYNHRLWHAHIRLVPELQCIAYDNKKVNREQDSNLIYLIGHTLNNQFQLFRLEARKINYGPYDLFLKSRYRAKYFNINQPEIIYQKTIEWLAESNGKYFKERNKIFTLEHFNDAKIKIQNYLPMVRMIDPLKQVVVFLEKKEFSFTPGLVIKEFLAFHPTAWLQDSGLDAFYSSLKICNTTEFNKRILIIGPNRLQSLGRIKNENDKHFKKLRDELNDKNLLCIQLNVGQHFITVEVDLAEAANRKCWNAMIADSLDKSGLLLSENSDHLEKYGVMNLLQLLEPTFKITVANAQHCTYQTNSYDCGVHGARRFYSYWKYDKVFPAEECDKKIMPITPFRLCMLEYILEESPSVSGYVSPTGKGITCPILGKYDDKTVKETPSLGRAKRNASKKSPVLPIPDSSVIFDVDAITDDNDESAKQIQVFINFDRDLFGCDAEGDILQEPTNIGNDTTDLVNDTILHPGMDKSTQIATGANAEIGLLKEQNEPSNVANDTSIRVENDTSHQSDMGADAEGGALEELNDVVNDTSLDVDTDISIHTLASEGEYFKEPTTIKPPSPHKISSHFLEKLSSEDDDTDSESGHSNPKKPRTASENESTESESYNSSIKTKETEDIVGGAILLKMKNAKKKEVTRTSPRSKYVRLKVKSTSAPAGKTVSIKIPSKTPKTQQFKRSTTKVRPNRTIPRNAPQRFANRRGRTLAMLQSNRVESPPNVPKAIEMGKKWDLTNLQPIDNYENTKIDEPTDENQQLLIANRIKEVNSERLKLGENELTKEEEKNWEKFYYHKTQLDKKALEESLQNEVSLELEKARKLQTKLHDAYLESIKLYGESNKVTKRKFEQYHKVSVEVMLLEFEFKRNPCFHPYNSIWSIRIDDNDIDDEKVWKYYIVYKASDDQFYEAPVAKAWLVDNLDAKYLKDLKTHCRARRYILYDDVGSKLTKDFKPYIEYLPRDNNNNLVKPIYTYRPKEDDVQILKVRALATFSKSPTTPGQHIINGRIRWAIYYLDKDEAPTKSTKYIDMNNSDMCDIVDPPLLEKWKKEIIQWFAEDFRTKASDPSSPVYPHTTRFIDRSDSRTYFTFTLNECKFSPLGILGQEQQYYWKTKQMKLYLNKTKTQISGIRFCKKKNVFFGLEADPTAQKTAHVQLMDSWVNDNFDEKIIKKIKEHAGQPIEKGRLYYKVPIGSSRDTNINNKWSHNPSVNYHQDGQGTCCFKSLSSAMSHLKLSVEAKLIDDFCNEFYSTSKFEDNFHRVPQVIIQHIRKNAGFKNFNRQYTIKKLKNDHDLIHEKCDKDDIRLVILHAQDYSINHAVSVVDGLIFDSNCANAMDLSLEALTEACNDNIFKSIHQGYMFKRKA